MGIRNILVRWLMRGATTTKNPAQWLVDYFNGGPTDAGIDVGMDSSITHTPVWAAVTLIAETVAALPLHVYRKTDAGRERVTNSAVARLLAVQPNKLMTAGPFVEALTGHVLIRGNAFAEIERDGATRPVGLWPLDPRKIQIRAESSGDLWYIYDHNTPIPGKNILHLRGFSDDGIIGYSPIQKNRETIGLGAAAQKYAAMFFGNDSSPGGVLQHPGVMTKEAAGRLKARWEDAHQGGNAHRTAVLEEGMTWQQIALSPEDSQLAEIRRMSVEDVARIYHIPPHKLQELTHATFSNIEHQGIEFLTQTLAPWLRRWREEVTAKLLTGNMYAEHVVESLLRGDIKTRYEAYRVGIAASFLMPNEARRWENLEEVEGGNVLLAPMNTTTIDKVGADPPKPDPVVEPATPDDEPTDEPVDEPDPDVIATAFRPLIIEAAQARIVGKEVKALRRAIGGDVTAAVESFYPKHRGLICKCLSPIVSALAASSGSRVDVDGYLVRLADELCINAAASAIDNEADLAPLLDVWEVTRSEILADRIIEDIAPWAE